MSRFSQSLPVLAALLGLIAVPGGSTLGAATIEWVNPPPAPEASAPLPPRQTPPQPSPPAPAPEASAPLPPRETTSQPQPRKARSGVRSQESALPTTSQGSSRSPLPGARLPRPAPENSALAEQASKFINSYWEQSSASGDEALRYLSSIYAPVVNYYGQQRTRNSVLQDKRAFFRHWPIRQTWPAFGAGNPTISCDRGRAECEITGFRDFAAESPKRDARSAGVVRYAYRVRFVDGTAQIVAESSKVVAAGAIAVSSPAALLPPR